MNFQCALVTGASSGLGREFAKQLAFRCEELVLVARREDVLQELAEELRQNHPALRVRVIAADLLSPEARGKLVAAALGEGKSAPDLLINNAGMGDYGEFSSGDWEKSQRMMALNMEVLTHLAHAFLPSLCAQKGAMINLSSLAGDLPIPDFAVYAATKAYVSSFSEALRLELRERGVKILVVCPGPVPTEFGANAQRGETGQKANLRKFFYLSAEEVVRGSLRALEKGKARHYPGRKVGVAACFISLLPRWLMRLVMGFRPRKIKTAR